VIFYRSSEVSGPDLRTTRFLTSFALAAYPAGALTLALGPEGRGGLFVFELVGLGFILLSLICAAPVLGSRFQRIVAEEAKQLDEFELQLRHRATASAYGIFGGLVLSGIIYAAIAEDAGWWAPRSYEELNGLFWGAFLYASLLPTFVLVWKLDPADGPRGGM
jgi:hypothetical protein